MAVPKRRTGKARKRKRRTHWKLTTPNLDKCSRCGAPRKPHRVCASCGYYGDRMVVEPSE
jgi:large subunit ribosomal protein L32